MSVKGRNPLGELVGN